MTKSTRRQEAIFALLFLAPFLFTLIVFFVYAFINSVRYSFTDYDLFNTPSWIGLQNYIEILRDPLFVRAFINTVSYSLIVTVIQTFLALALATVLNQKLRGINIFRTIYYLPSVLSSAAVTLIFLWLYQRNGFINFAISWFNQHIFIILGFIGIFLLVQGIQVFIENSRGLPANFFNPALAAISFLVAIVLTVGLYSFSIINPRDVAQFDQVWLNTRERWLGIPVTLWAIMLQNIYTTIPTFMLIYLAGLQDVPNALYEAAAIDGANRWQQFTRVTIPMLQPVTFLIVTLSLIGTLQLFDQVALFGDAAPLESKVTLAFYVYDAAFPSASVSRIGEASAAALILGILILAIVMLQRVLGIREEAH